jgi:FkbM family methyltransferase
MSHLKSRPIAIIARKLFALFGADYEAFRYQSFVLQKQCEKFARKIFEPMGIDYWSKPAIFDMDNKLQKYLSYSNGFFIEAGANNGFDQSNTYYLEKFKNWQGVLIEPIPELYEQCVAERTQSRVFNCALVSQDYDQPTLKMKYIGLMSMVSGLFQDKEKEKAHVEVGVKIQGKLSPYEIEVPARTLTSILDQVGTENIDFFSLDVEQFELEVLKGLDLSRYRPKYFLIETDQKQSIDDYLENYYVQIDQLTFHDYLYQRKDDLSDNCPS